MRFRSCLLFLVLTLSSATSLVAQGAAVVADPCEDNKVRAAIAEPRVKLGLTPLPYDRAKQTLEQNRQLAVAYRELVGQCPKRADLLLELLFVTAADPQTSEAEVLRLADLAATAFADPSLPPSPLPGGLQVAEILVDHKAGPETPVPPGTRVDRNGSSESNQGYSSTRQGEKNLESLLCMKRMPPPWRRHRDPRFDPEKRSPCHEEAATEEALLRQP